MSEFQPLPMGSSMIECLQQIGRFCISPGAIIDESHIYLEMSPDGIRHTRIGDSVVEPGVVIEGQVQVDGGARVERRASVQFRSSIGARSRIGRDVVLGTGVTVGEDAVVYPESKIGNFARIGDGSVVFWGSILSSQAYLGPGLYFKGTLESDDLGNGILGASSTIKRIEDWAGIP